jgi:hypothetical protein
MPSSILQLHRRQSVQFRKWMVSSAVQEMDGVEVWGAKVRVGKAVGVPEKVFEREIWESEEDVLKTMRDVRAERGVELEQHPA